MYVYVQEFFLKTHLKGWKIKWKNSPRKLENLKIDEKQLREVKKIRGSVFHYLKTVFQNETERKGEV